MRFPFRQPVAALGAVVTLGLCGWAQAGMQLQPRVVEPLPLKATAATPVAAPPQASPKPRASASPPPVPMQREEKAWTPCIRLINSAAMGAAVDAERQQALLEHCES